MCRHNKKLDDGFTLIELIVVITIIGILAATVVVNVSGRSDQAKKGRVDADFAAIKMAAKMFREDHSRWPDSLEEMYDHRGGCGDCSLNVSYIDNAPEDPFSTNVPKEWYYFEIAENGPLLISFGADQTEGGEGFDADIYSDDERY